MKQFLNKFWITNEGRVTLMKKYNPVPTLQKGGNCEPQEISTVQGSIMQTRKLPRLRLFQEDAYVMFEKQDTVTSLSENTKAFGKPTLVKKSDVNK